MRIVRVQTCPGWVRVTFADGAACDIDHTATPAHDRPRDDAERTAYEAADVAFYAAAARQCRVCHSREAREVRAIAAAAGRLAGRCEAVVEVLQAGASEACDALRSDARLTGRGIGDRRMTKADEVAAFYGLMARLAAQLRSRAYDLSFRLPVVAGLDPAAAPLAGRPSRTVAQVATFHPPGARRPRMGPVGDPGLGPANELPAGPAPRTATPRQGRGKGATPARKSVVPPVIAERMRPSVNGHAAGLNGTH